MIKNETAYQMNELLVIRSAYAKVRIEAPVNGGRNYNGPKVAKFLVG